MLLEHERDYDFGMDALVTVCSWRICGLNGSMTWPAQGIPYVLSCGVTSGLRAEP